MQYSDILEQLPEQLLLPVHKPLERLREELLDSVKRSDFERLEAVVTELAEDVRNLAQAQARTEPREEELAQARAKTEATVQELLRGQLCLEKEAISLKREQREIRHRLGVTLQSPPWRSMPGRRASKFIGFTLCPSWASPGAGGVSTRAARLAPPPVPARDSRPFLSRTGILI